MFFHIPVELATSPRDGMCLTDCWWAVHPEKGVAFYAQLSGYTASDKPSPQCHRIRSSAEFLQKKLLPDHEVRHLPVVYLEHAMAEMLRLRSAHKRQRRRAA